MAGSRRAAGTGHKCIVPGCAKEGRNRLGIRCRIAHHGTPPVPKKGRTSALWAPDAEAYLCDAHALGGAHMTILFEPDTSQEVTVKVIATTTVDERTTPIKQT
jgi:hypothetical protein